jgi:hypothetical protein
MFALSIIELTIRQVVADLPHDLGAFIAYFVLAAFAAFIVYGSRNPDAGGDEGPQDAMNSSGE